MEHRRCRSVTIVVLASLAIAVSAPPARADAGGPPPPEPSLATLSSASLRLLSRSEPARAAAQEGTPQATSFFKTRKGIAAIAVMVAGTAFTVWSINHDRKPVKSPIR